MQKLTFSALFLSVSVLLMACTAGDEPDSGINSLEQFQWENRILILFTDAGSREPIIDQLQAEQALVDDRDMLWFVVTQPNNRVETSFTGGVSRTLGQTLVERYQQRPDDGDDGLEVVLIGKDGGVKYRADTLNTDGIYFEVIDVMPMRRAEMLEDG